MLTTLVYCTGKNVTELTNNMQICVVAIREWYDMNRLVINNTKSNVMLVITRQMLSRIDNTDINICIDQKLLQCSNINYLGIEIDCTLSWDLQIDILCKKLFFIISKLSRLKAVIPSYLLLLVYASMIQPKIDYAISIWGYTSRHNLNKIQRLQNRAARIITGNHDYVNTRGIELVKTLKWMCVSQRRYYFMLLLLFDHTWIHLIHTWISAGLSV